MSFLGVQLIMLNFVVFRRVNEINPKYQVVEPYYMQDSNPLGPILSYSKIS
jgi:hypothetical protein